MGKNNNKPKLRFPGFTDPWKQRKLGEMCEEFQSGKNIKAEEIKENGAYPVYGGNGFRGYSDTYNHDGIYALIGRQGALCGNMNISSGKAYFTEHAIAVRANKSSETRFLFYLLGKMNLGQYSGQSAQPGLAVNKLLELSSSVPNYDEQKQISEFFVLLDHLITLHQRKLNHLQEKKKSLLQKMFPKNGEDFPELRFLEFTDPWEQRKLGEMLNLLKDGTHGTHKDVDEGVYLLSAKNIKNGNILIDSDSERKISNRDFEKIHKSFRIQKNDVLMTIVGTIGECAKVENPHNITFQRSVAYLRPNEKLSSDFLIATIKADNFQSELKKRQSISAQPGIYLGELAEICISIPNKEEQFIIGTFFNNIDNLITLHQRKLNHLKEQKKALLQQMFV